MFEPAVELSAPVICAFGQRSEGERRNEIMIRYKEIAFVAYPVTDIARARQFYEGVLNLKPNAPLESEHPHWVEYDIGSGTLGIGSSPQWLPSQDGASAALEVEDFNAAVASLREHNVPIIVGPMEMPTCHMATVRDPDGNKLTLHRRKVG
jgi:predicted enzyme related to lactoylglutathione lyase